MNKQEYARRLRRNQTQAEHKMWWLVLLGFRRQYVVNGYIADFYNPAAGVIVEIDGSIHKKRKQQDKQRDKHNRAVRVSTIRISNDKALYGFKGFWVVELVLWCVVWFVWRHLII